MITPANFLSPSQFSKDFPTGQPFSIYHLQFFSISFFFDHSILPIFGLNFRFLPFKEKLFLANLPSIY